MKLIIVSIVRALVLVSKFIFTIYLARALSIGDFGFWVLLTASLSYGLFIIGAEVNNITIRDYAILGEDKGTAALSKQISFSLVMYLIVTIFGIVFFLNQKTYSFQIIMVCAMLLILEHATHLVHLIAIYSNHQIHANMILLIKTAFWMIPTIYLFDSPLKILRLENILNYWLFGCVLALIYSIFVYRFTFIKLKLFSFKIKYSSVKGIVISLLPFWILALATKTPLIVDRYLIEIYSDIDQVSVYGYYFAFSNGIQSMFDAVIISKFIPMILNKSQIEKKVEVILFIKKYIKYSIIFWIFSILIIYNIMPFFNQYTHKEIINNSRNLFILITSAQLLFSSSAIIQYALYANQRDGELKIGGIIYLSVSIICFFVFIPYYGNYGAAIALNISSLILLLYRFKQITKLHRI